MDEREPASLLDLPTAEADRRGHDGQRVALNASDVRWKAAAEAAWRELIAAGDATADDLHAKVGHLASSPNAIGAIIGASARRGEVVAVGVATSRRASRHGGLQRVWRGVS